jgi:hypothetical protein
MDTYGFVLTRHVNTPETNKYWNTSVQCIQKLYPSTKIIIIDDNSNYDLIKPDYEYNNVTIIQSEFIGRGELLPYYYYLQNKWFENAVIIHDSVFFHKRINFEKLTIFQVLPLWHFKPDNENTSNLLRIASSLQNNTNIRYMMTRGTDMISTLSFKDEWYGCFGVQTFINHNFLLNIERKYKITNMIHFVKNRPDRCCLERILGCLFYIESTNKKSKIKSLFGNILNVSKKLNYKYADYTRDVEHNKITRPVIKVWTGR